jgi:hypothetical protein
MVRVYNVTKVLTLETAILVFRISFHTSYLSDVLTLKKDEMEGERSGPLTDDRCVLFRMLSLILNSTTLNRISSAFFVEMQFSVPGEPPPVDRSQKPPLVTSNVVPPPGFTCSSKYN